MRSKRAELRMKLKSGSLSLQDVLNSKDMRSSQDESSVFDSIAAAGWEVTKKIMEEIGINENRRVQGLGKRQINALLERLG